MCAPNKNVRYVKYNNKRDNKPIRNAYLHAAFAKSVGKEYVRINAMHQHVNAATSQQENVSRYAMLVLNVIMEPAKANALVVQVAMTQPANANLIVTLVVDV
jgi:hypothetical protein